jgi:hypothetical protein
LNPVLFYVPLKNNEPVNAEKLRVTQILGFLRRHQKIIYFYVKYAKDKKFEFLLSTSKNDFVKSKFLDGIVKVQDQGLRDSEECSVLNCT